MQRKIGVVVPCANPAVEPEIHKLAPSSYFPYVARFPNYPDLDLKQRLAKYRSDLPAAINTLKGLDLDGVLVACTGSSYPIGLSGDKNWTDAASEQLGKPVVSAAGSVSKVLQSLNAKELVLISPYPAWLTSEMTEFWVSAGYKIVELVEINKSGKIYDLTKSEMAKTLSEANSRSGKKGSNRVLLVAGTGVPSLEPIEEMITSVDIPVVTSQIAGIWNLFSEMKQLAQIPNSGSAALNKLHNQILKGATI
jgi:maleate isomerase